MQDKQKDKFWLFAFQDYLANLRTFSNGIESVDVDGSGDYKLLVADGKKALRTFSGTAQLREVKLPSVPSALTRIIMPNVSCKVPVVAVAVGAAVLMFSNDKPLYRYYIPPVPVDPEEEGIWDLLLAGVIPIPDGVEMLQERLEQGAEATSRTLDLLLLDNAREREAFVAQASATPLQQQDTITCMEAIAHTLEGPEKGPSSLVIGTERRLLYVLNPTCTEILLKVELPSAPAFFIVAGCFTSEYRIVVSCRHGQIYSIKNGVLATHVIQPDGAVCAMVRYDNQIVVATTANTVTHFSLKGKRHLTLYFRQPVANLVTISDPVTGAARGLVVSLSDGELRVYVGKTLSHVSSTCAPTTALAFGRYGREESALIAVLQNGSLMVQLLHRNALLDVKRSEEVVPATEQDIPIPVPRWSSIFKTQTAREALHGAGMYRSFQYDLCHLRLQTARKYVEVFGGGSSHIAAADVARAIVGRPASGKARLHSTIQGLGPVFKIRLELEALDPQPLRNLLILITYDPLIYHMQTSLCVVPFIAPGHGHKCSFVIRVVEGEDGGEPVSVWLLREDSQDPLASLQIELPEREFMDSL
eukprot:gene6124-4405_t